MQEEAFLKMRALAVKPQALENTIAYLADCLRNFLRPQERFLICAKDNGPFSLSGVFGEAARRVGAVPVFWDGEDRRWKALLRLAFVSKARAAAGSPLILLGLSKLVRATNTPLAIRNLVLTGYPGARWMEEGIQKLLDCKTWHCYAPGGQSVVAGFSCKDCGAIHLRKEAYSVLIVDEQGKEVPYGEQGEVIIRPKADISVRLATTELCRLVREPCSCGNPAPRLMDFALGSVVDKTQIELGESLLRWSSVLDYRAKKTDSGLELEVVTFPGEPLPKLPTCAKRIVRPWEPDRDIPFTLREDFERPGIYGENH